MGGRRQQSFRLRFESSGQGPILKHICLPREWCLGMLGDEKCVSIWLYIPLQAWCPGTARNPMMRFDSVLTGDSGSIPEQWAHSSTHSTHPRLERQLKRNGEKTRLSVLNYGKCVD